MSRSVSLILVFALACKGSADDTDTGPVVDTGCEVDVDRDGYCADEDCDDTKSIVHPGALEVPYDGEDQDCDGFDISDVDGDGHDGIPAGGDDCNDSNPEVYPGAPEDCYVTLDYNCDGFIPRDDCDNDGFTRHVDCDDENPEAYPGQVETWYDGIDADCKYDSDFDKDHDYDEVLWQESWDTSGWPEDIIIWDPDYDPLVGGSRFKFVKKADVIGAWNGDDCDDEDVTVYGKAKEPWDRADRDCDGLVDVIDISDSFAKWDGSAGVGDKNLGTAVAILGDLDGDGWAEVAASDDGKLDYAGGVYLLSPGNEDGRAAVVMLGNIDGPAGSLFGWSMANVGDIDGDLKDDLAVGVPLAETPGAYIFSGSKLVRGTTLTAADRMVVLGGGDLSGLVVANVGDIDGDSYNEILVGTNAYALLTYSLFSGVDAAAGGALGTGSAVALVSDDTIAGGAAAGGVDLDGDGTPDLALSAVNNGCVFDPTAGTGTTHVGSGQDVVGLLSPGDLTTITGTTGCFGNTIGTMDDVDGDGYAELVIADPGVTVAGEVVDVAYAGRLYVIDGNDIGAKGVDEIASFIVEGSEDNGRMKAVQHSADHDGDGSPDLIAAMPGNFDPYSANNFDGIDPVGQGWLLWYPSDIVAAGGTVPADDALATFGGKSDASAFGDGIDVGDLDGDGYADLAVGQTFLPGGKVYAFLSSLMTE